MHPSTPSTGRHVSFIPVPAGPQARSRWAEAKRKPANAEGIPRTFSQLSSRTTRHQFAPPTALFSVLNLTANPPLNDNYQPARTVHIQRNNPLSHAPVPAPNPAARPQAASGNSTLVIQTPNPSLYRTVHAPFTSFQKTAGKPVCVCIAAFHPASSGNHPG